MPHTKVATKTQVTGKVEAEYIQYVIKHLYSVQEVPIVNPKIVNLPEGVTFEQLVAEKKIWLTEIPVELFKQVPVEKFTIQEISAGSKVITRDREVVLRMQDPKITFNEVHYTQGMIVCMNLVVRKEVEVQIETITYKGKY